MSMELSRTGRLSRRQFASRSILVAFASAIPFAMSGCGVFADILAWTAVAGTAIDGIVSVLGTLVTPGAAAIIQAIKAFLTDLAAAITQYQNDTNPADKATLLAKIRTLLSDIGSNLQSFFQQIVGTSPVINIALGLGQVILAAIMGFLGQLPTAGAGRLSANLSAGGRSLTVSPKFYKSVGAFKRDYNAVCEQNSHPELEIK